tara:strand:+ start:3073 stop:5301 length:2229 start_codon:yes stop_codon:yes gene_type:complete
MKIRNSIAPIRTVSTPCTLATKILLVFTIIFSFSIPLSAQSNYDLSKTDTAEINKAIAYVKANILISPNKLIPTIDSINSYSQKLEYTEGIFESNNLRGITYWMVEDYRNAFDKYKKALSYAEFLPNPRKKALVLGNMGMCYANLFQLDSAEYYLQKSIGICKQNNLTDLELKNKFEIGNLYLQQDQYIPAIEVYYAVLDSLKIHDNKQLQLLISNTLGILFTNIGKYDMAIEFYKQSIGIGNELKDIDIKTSNYFNLGETYFEIEQFDSSRYYFQKALASSLPYNRVKTTLAVNAGLGNICLHTHELDSCYLYYQKVLSDSLIHTDPIYLASVTVNMGLYYYKKEDYTKSKEYLLSGLQMTRDLKLARFERNTLQTLYRVDSLEGDFEAALQHLSEFRLADERLAKDAANLAVKSLEFDHYLAKQNVLNNQLTQENEHQQKQIRNKNFLIYGFIALAILLLVLFYFSYQARLKAKELVVELSAKNNKLKQLNEEVRASNSLLAQSEDELQKSNQTKDKFFSILGHDLKSPFYSLLGLLEVMDEQWEEMEDSQKHFLIKKLYSSSKKTYALLENLLNWGKAQGGQIKLNPEKFLLSEKVQSIVELYHDAMTSKKIQIIVGIDTNIQLNTDIMLLSQIIQNFVNNAIKFTPKGGQIEITAVEKTETIQICVTDTGIGIPKDKVATIFDLDSSYNRKGTEEEESTGMGLILTVEYASILNGKLSATSIENKGSTFCVEIPNTIA